MSRILLRGALLFAIVATAAAVAISLRARRCADLFVENPRNISYINIASDEDWNDFHREHDSLEQYEVCFDGWQPVGSHVTELVDRGCRRYVFSNVNVNAELIAPLDGVRMDVFRLLDVKTPDDSLAKILTRSGVMKVDLVRVQWTRRKLEDVLHAVSPHVVSLGIHGDHPFDSFEHQVTQCHLLQRLDLGECGFSLKDVQALSSLHCLRRLYINERGLNKSDVQRIREQLNGVVVSTGSD